MDQFILLLQKDLRSEFRSRETLTALFTFAILGSVVVSVAITGSRLPEDVIARLYPGLIWVVFVLSSSSAIGRTFEYELRHGAIEGLLLNNVSPVAIYLSKVFSLTFFGLLAFLASSTLLAILLGNSIFPPILPLIIIGFAVNLGYAALATLSVPMSSALRAKTLFLPIILVPLIFPLILSAIELSRQLMQTGSVDFASPWCSLLIGIDVIYLALGVNLYEHVLRD